MDKVVTFISSLSQNNNRDWFERNRSMYEEAQGRFNLFAEELIKGISSFDPTVEGLTVKDTTYRIYRDVRFSRDKSPYKTHMGVYIVRGGKKSGYAGYYFHLEPLSGDGGDNTLLSSGLYMPEPKVLRSVREEILDNGQGVVDAIDRAKGFELDSSNKLVRMPKGFEPSGEYDELIKQKDLHMVKLLGSGFVLKPNLVERLVELFAPTRELIYLINRAVAYAYEDME